MNEFDYLAEGHRRMRARELSGVRAENVLLRIYLGRRATDATMARVERQRSPRVTFLSRVESQFNGHPLKLDEVLPGEDRQRVRFAVHNLAKRKRLEQVSYGVYQRVKP